MALMSTSWGQACTMPSQIQMQLIRTSSRLQLQGGLGSNQPVEGIAIGTTWQEYSGLSQNFSMEMPSGWELQEQGSLPEYLDIIPLTERALV